VSQNNLDITTVGTEDLDTLASKIEDYYKQDTGVKSSLVYHWERNHRFLDGQQWLVYSGTAKAGGQWSKLEVSKDNEYIPRPTTNYIFDVYQTLKSYLIKNKPRSQVTPNTQLHADKQAAKIGTLCLEANYERLKESYNYEYAAANIVAYGTVIKKSYWDTTALQLAKVPRMETIQTQTGPQEVQAKDPMTGEPLFDEIPLGDVNTCIVEPQRFCIDPLASDLHNSRWVMEFSIQPISWIQETYDRQEEGYTGRVAEVIEEKSLSGSMKKFYDMKNSSGVKSMGGMDSSGGGGDGMVENSAVVKEYYERPSFKYPKGRLVAVANGIPLYAGPSPYEGPEMGDWHPYSECRWELVPGRFWGKGPLDDACEIQKQINSIDSVIILVRKTMAIPQKLIPKGSGLNKGEWTGRPGQEIEYRDLGTGAKPETIPASGVDAQIFQEREQRLQDLKNNTGAIDILKGDRPPGVTAASALNLLYEVGTGKLFPILDRWKAFVECDQKKQLKLIAHKYKEPRPEFIRLLKAKNAELSEADINKFIGSDLLDNCNVSVEAGSNVPKLQAAKQAMLLEVAATGALNLELPANRIQFQNQLGIAGFDNDVGPDTKRAEWENGLLDNLENTPDQKPVVLYVDNHQVHREVHAKRMKEPSFMSLPVGIQQAYMAHYQEHEQMEQQAAEAMQFSQMAAGAAPGPAGPGGPSGTAPTPIEGAGKGASKELKNAVMGDALSPASLGQGSRR
jgi:hypothetical protein